MAVVSRVTEAAFVARRRGDWEALSEILHGARGLGLARMPAESVAKLPVLYREVCADLSRAQDAHYSAPLIDFLEGLGASAHAVLYRKRHDVDPRSPLRSGSALFEAFPRAIRRHKGSMLLGTALFFVPFFISLAYAYGHPEFAFRVLPEASLRGLTEAYKEGFEGGRSAGMDALMAGFYIHNNVGIALRCFALGITFGMGSAFYLFENGVMIGATMGYVASQGAGDNILTFCIGHGAFELGAICISGGAGIRMGWALVRPGEPSRARALSAISQDLVVLIAGASAMLLLAAGIEAFWSGSSAPATIKRAFGLLFHVVVLLYILLVGRGGQDSRERGVR